ncbi:MAG TPA: hypothetical protein VK186_27075 [Candidatus Deferrimicrobium sp.]|nr:hypothetical protein [Candidatus Kapabacteria bacterium]HLP62531.1 hypothetical protein [Candidatus Deferrimicrobium sp.]
MIPIPVNIVIEDDLSKEMIKNILKQSGGHFLVNTIFPDLKRENSNAGCNYIKKRINGFNSAAKIIPYIVLTDLDENECAPSLMREWIPNGKHPNLLFRVAVREVEAWVMADRNSFAKFLGIEPKIIPLDIDVQIQDPKRFLLDLTRRSRKKDIQIKLLPRKGSTAKVGPYYNQTLIAFLYDHWQLDEAIKYSDSLKRMCRSIRNFKPQITI